jgi:uncharacterized protein YraI
MRNFVGLCGVGALMVTTSMTSAYALNGFATIDLNVRAGPGPQYPVVTTIDNNGAVDMHGCVQSWCDLTWQGARGWAYSPYLAVDQGGTRVVVADAEQAIQVPAAEFEVGTYWDQNYQDQPFYEEREQYRAGGTAAGAATGAVVGAVIGGPVGAAVGAVAGGAIGTAAAPPERIRTYVVDHRVEPVIVEGEVVVGGTLPEPVVLHPVPDYEYTYAVVNGQSVLVDPTSRQIVYVYR